MGHFRHHAIVVTSCSEQALNLASRQAVSVFGRVSEPVASASNCYQSFLIPPDGSKEGWETSNVGDLKRDRFIGWMTTHWMLKLPEIGGNLHWVEVAYGDSEWADSTVERFSPELQLELRKQGEHHPFPEATLEAWQRHESGTLDVMEFDLASVFNRWLAQEGAPEEWSLEQSQFESLAQETEASSFRMDLAIACDTNLAASAILAKLGLFVLRGLLLGTVSLEAGWRVTDLIMSGCAYRGPLQFNGLHLWLDYYRENATPEWSIRDAMIELLQALKMDAKQQMNRNKE